MYQKHNYLNKEVTHLVNTSIREYDMKSGGFSILKKAEVFTDSELQMLESMPKYERNVWIGNLLRREKALNQVLMEGFIEARRLLFEYNDIGDHQILSIKKDAIFVINYPLTHTEFDGFKFELKNSYSSYYLLNGKEFYFRGKTKTMDVKGIGDDVLEDHQEYFLKDLGMIFSLAEKGNSEYLIKYLRRYRDNYLNHRLPIETYRELNMENAYRTTYGNALGTIMMDASKDSTAVDIGYNYIKYLIPLIGYYL